MGERLKETVAVPKWMFAIVLTILMAILGFTASFAGTKQEVIQNTKSIEYLQNTKADKETLTLILEGQKRIESKLDTHIAQRPQ
jgi:hypothetical protein